MSVVLFSGFGDGALAQEGVTNILKAANQERGLFQKEPEGGATTVVTKGGSAARSTTPPDGKTGGFMYFANGVTIWMPAVGGPFQPVDNLVVRDTPGGYTL